MLNYAETKSVSTIVPVESVPCREYQEHVLAHLSALATLLEHPEFQEGLTNGQGAFEERLIEEHHEKFWTEEDVIEFVERELSGKRHRHDQYINQIKGWPSLSYIHRLGFVIGYLNQALKVN